MWSWFDILHAGALMPSSCILEDSPFWWSLASGCNEGNREGKAEAGLEGPRGPMSAPERGHMPNVCSDSNEGGKK